MVNVKGRYKAHGSEQQEFLKCVNTRNLESAIGYTYIYITFSLYFFNSSMYNSPI